MRALNDRLFDWFDRSPSNRTKFALAWTSSVFAVVLLPALLGILSPTYKVTDNSGILSMIEEGAETPFISQVLSGSLTFLYQNVTDRVPWFGIANYAALFWALALFIHAMASMPRARVLFWQIVSLFSLVFLMFLIRCGYNSSSILLSGIAALAFAAYAREARLTKTTALVCGLGLAYGFLFRPRGMQGAFVIIGPALLAFGAMRPSRYSLAMLLLFVLPIGVVGTTHVLWKTYGISDEYREFREFNRLRGKFHSYPIAKHNKDNFELFKINGWRKYHYLLFKDWFYVDEDLWNLEKLQNIFEFTMPLPEDQLGLAVFSDAIARLFEQFGFFGFLLPLWLVAVLLARDRHVLAWSAGFLIYLIVLTLYLRIALRLPQRIGDPVFTLAFASGVWILLAGTKPITLGDSRIGKAFLACHVLALASFAYYQFDLAKRFTKRNAVFESRLADFNLWFQGRIMFIQPAILKSHDQNPLKVYAETYDSVPLGWRTQSPQFYDFVRRHGMKRGAELITFALDNEDVFFVWARGRIGALIAFLWYDHGVRARIQSFDGLSDTRYLVFQLQTDPDPPKSLSMFNRIQVETKFDRKAPDAPIPMDEDFDEDLDDEDR